MTYYSSSSLNYFEAEHYLNEGLIRTTLLDTPNKLTNREWMLRFLDDLKNPEQYYPAVHVAGTSGKGSTAIMIAEVLRASGYRVGLHTSPYLQVATEKLWIDGKYAGAEEFIDLVEWIRPYCEKWRSPEAPLHGMASIGICLEYFRRKKIDIAVIECGVGGRDDFTNVLKTALSVITPIDIDHQKVLGRTINEISLHKAGIIKNQIPVVALMGNGSEIIRDIAKINRAPVTWVRATDTQFPKIRMQGKFQNQNAAIAKKACTLLSGQGFKVGEEHVNFGLSVANLPGRMEVVSEEPRIILDGAHNFHKLDNLLREFTDKKVTIIFGALASKISDETVYLLDKDNFDIVLTAPIVYGKPPFDPNAFMTRLKKAHAVVVPNPLDALKITLKKNKTANPVLITGSLYLTGMIRDYFYPKTDIVACKNSWPQPARQRPGHMQ